MPANVCQTRIVVDAWSTVVTGHGTPTAASAFATAEEAKTWCEPQVEARGGLQGMHEPDNITAIERQLHDLAKQVRMIDRAYAHALVAVAMALPGEPGFDNAALHLAHFLKDAPPELMSRAYTALSVLERGGTDMDAVHAMRQGTAASDGG